jgi:hypothetical protein
MKRIIGKLLVPILVISLIFGCTTMSFGTDTLNERESVSMEATLSYYRQYGNIIDDWEVLVAIAGAGGDLQNGDFILPDWDETAVPTDALPSTFGSKILGLVAMGENPSNIWGRNLIDELVAKQGDDGAFGSPLDQIFAMLALDLVGAEYDSEGAITALISMQGENGGFGYALGVEDIDSTGIALVALSNHMDNEVVTTAIEDTLAYVKSLQIESGGFESYGMENANSVARVIMGLVAVSEDIYSEAWQVNGNTMIDALYSFEFEDHSYKWLVTDTETNPYATKEALIALSDITYGESVFKRLPVDFEIVQSGMTVKLKMISDWAIESVYIAEELGLLIGDSNIFAPQENMTRAEFVKLIMTVVNNQEPLSVENPFTDIAEGDWYYETILRAYQIGIVSGTSETTFEPNKGMTREEMAVMLANAFSLSSDESVQFNDSDRISDWAMDDINAVYEAGFLIGYSDSFYPKEIVSKETGTVMIVRVYQWYKEQKS